MAKKNDIQQVRDIAIKYELSKAQQRILHDYMQMLKPKGATLSFEEIAELAQEVKRNYPNK
jgi:hypothetical protein